MSATNLYAANIGNFSLGLSADNNEPDFNSGIKQKDNSKVEALLGEVDTLDNFGSLLQRPERAHLFHNGYFYETVVRKIFKLLKTESSEGVSEFDESNKAHFLFDFSLKNFKQEYFGQEKFNDVGEFIKMI